MAGMPISMKPKNPLLNPITSSLLLPWYYGCMPGRAWYDLAMRDAVHVVAGHERMWVDVRSRLATSAAALALSTIQHAGRVSA